MRIAALDLGSNSFHLIVTDAQPDGTLTPVAREKSVLRLGEVVARHGHLTEDAVEDALQTLRRFSLLIDAAGADETVVCATAALRDAANRDEVIRRIKDETGLDVRLIDGLEEARLIFSAVCNSLVIDPAPALCLDLGGGSLELTIGDPQGLRWSESVPLGVGRLTAQLVESDPLRKRDVAAIRDRVREVLGELRDDVRRRAPAMLIGTSGTFLCLAAMAAYRRKGSPPQSLNQLRITRDEVVELQRLLTRTPLAERRALPGMDSRRAETMPTGAVLLHQAMDLFDLDTMTVGTWGLREGMVLDAVRRHVRGGNEPDDMRAVSVAELCRRYASPEEHSRHVAELSVSLFDQTEALHGLSRGERELLWFAALLHDIGEHIGTESADHHTAYLLEHGQLRGFDPGEVAMLACLARYHRRGTPKDDFPPYARLTDGRKEAVNALAAILRLVHGLDHGRTTVVQRLHVEIDSDQIRIRVAADGDVRLSLWGAERARKRFERVFGRSVTLEPVPSTAVA